MSDAILELKGIRKKFDDTEVLKEIDLSVKAGEFITLLGSSGCGKTTTLRIIAGLEYPDAGQVILEGQDVTEKQPDKRDVNTVFQNYALFPHMTVGENVAYGMKLRRVSKAEQKRRVSEVLELVQLSGYEKRKPSQLSGGQRQRVAIARAIVNNPRVLLLDEPLGALDLQLRRQMQIELKRLQKKLGMTFVYITHDQEEAINMSDRIAVMHRGRFEQIGKPDEIYDYPKTEYVARFVGNANIIEGTVTGRDGSLATLRAEGGTVQADCTQTFGSFDVGARIRIAVRSEYLRIEDCPSETGEERSGICCMVQEISFAGGMLRMSLLTQSGRELVASRHGVRPDRRTGEKVLVSWDGSSACVVEQSAPDGEEAVYG